MRPLATVRLQFHKDFPLDAARERLDYFQRLGISHVYASPLQTAQPGSQHGYDVVDPTRINPELGGMVALRRLAEALRERGMGLILDIVPNHMGIGVHNPWWWSVLEWGPASPYAEFFDINWRPAEPSLRNRLLLPVLGQPLGESLAAGEVQLALDRREGRLHFEYYDQRFPLTPRSYASVLAATTDVTLRRSAGVFARLRAPGPAQQRAHAELADRLLTRGRLQALQQTLRRLAAQTSEGRDRLHALLQQQAYRLAWWRTSYDELNWRRFFDVTSLVALRMDRAPVFDAVHGLVLELYGEGLIDGVRIDHIDGLADPGAYCRRLRRRLETAGRRRPAGLRAQRPYIVVEKILGSSERLPQDWGTDGTTGYDFMNEVAALLHDPAGAPALQELWAQISGRSPDFEDEVREARQRMVRFNLNAEVQRMVVLARDLARGAAATQDFTAAALQRALTALLIAFPVYRSYATAVAPEPDADVLAQAVAQARRALRPELQPVLEAWAQWLNPRVEPGESLLRRELRLRFQHLTPALAAKAVEDTAFYRYGVLLSRNEVGANPARQALPPADFHALCAYRARAFPEALLATATHDHKRGEDARARLAVLSEMPDVWARAIAQWRRHNNRHRRSGAPTPGDEYILYQCLVGAWPLELRAEDGRALARFRERIAAWQEKALREAKLKSDWLAVDAAYEAACRRFLERILADRGPGGFVRALTALVRRIAPAGALNGLTQTLLRLTCPGVPDLYQGSEFWDFSLVDPDNRRPVDYALRAAGLEAEMSLPDLLPDWHDGRIKQGLITRALVLRAHNPALFRDGRYRPLGCRGPHANRMFAFARELRGEAAITLVPRLCADLVASGSPTIPAQHWEGTQVLLPPAWRKAAFEDVLTGRVLHPARGALALNEVLADLPLALLRRRRA